jgi:DNA polymerase I-like protein with 3'-5' exonuclease and polymerase domains
VGEIDPAWFEREMRTMRVLYRMSRRGIPYDAPGSLATADLLDRQIAAATKTLPFGPNSAKDYYFKPTTSWVRNPHTGARTPCLGLEPYETSEKTGAPSFTEKVRLLMERDDVPHIRTMSDIAKMSTAGSMWYRGFGERVGADGRLRTYFRQTHVRSGRFSVERVNLQAIPQDYRLTGYDCMAGLPTPRQLILQAYLDRYPGWLPFELDWAQAELRVAAQAAQCTKMLEMIEAGVDMHGFAATELMGVHPGDPDWFKYRQVFKRFNFSAIFGIGWVKLQYDIAKQTGVYWSDEQTRTTLDGWNALYPEFGAAIDRYSWVARRKQFTELVNGKRRWYTRDELDNTHKAFNQYVQGSLAELGKDIMIWIEDLMRSEGITEHRFTDGTEAGLHLMIHDSYLLHLPEDRAEDLTGAIAAHAGPYGTEMFRVPMALEGGRFGAK